MRPVVPTASESHSGTASTAAGRTACCPGQPGCAAPAVAAARNASTKRRQRTRADACRVASFDEHQPRCVQTTRPEVLCLDRAGHRIARRPEPSTVALAVDLAATGVAIEVQNRSTPSSGTRGPGALAPRRAATCRSSPAAGPRAGTPELLSRPAVFNRPPWPTTHLRYRGMNSERSRQK